MVFVVFEFLGVRSTMEIGADQKMVFAWFRAVPKGMLWKWCLNVFGPSTKVCYKKWCLNGRKMVAGRSGTIQTPFLFEFFNKNLDLYQEILIA